MLFRSNLLYLLTIVTVDLLQMPVGAVKFSSRDGTDRTEQVLAALRQADPTLADDLLVSATLKSV